MKIKYSDGVLRAQKKNRPILALESTIISHGMPFPDNLEFAKKAEGLCRAVSYTHLTLPTICSV